nr:hypothetical protein [Fournierella massiliensis]
MERLIERLENVLDDCIDSISSIQRSVLNNAIKYLSDITDVLGDTYDLDQLPDVVDSYGRLRKEKLADYDMIQGLIARGVKVRMTKEEL